MKRLVLVTLMMAAVLSSSRARAETVGTLTLDALSYVSFQDQQVLSLAGGTIRFHFGEPQSDGSVPFSIAPGDVSIPDISLSGGQILRYALASGASGSLHPSATGQTVALNASITATLIEGEGEGTSTYAVPFTTETASASSDGQTVSVTGVRIVPQARYVQLVGATVNKPDAVPQPGTAVYTVLSGSFDQLP